MRRSAHQRPRGAADAGDFHLPKPTNGVGPDQASALGPVQVAVLSAGNVGQMLKDRGDSRGAEEAYKRCAERGSARGLMHYAGLLSMRSDASFDEVRAVCRRLCDAEDYWLLHRPNVDAGLPMLVFGGLWERCDPEAMEAGAREADESGSAAGAYHLAAVHMSRGESAEAAATSIRAAQRGYGDAWLMAATALHQVGDLQAAEDAARNGESAGVAEASTLLGLILYAKGDTVGELEAYKRADAQGDGGGSYRLGIELMDGGDYAGANAALARAVERGGDGTEGAAEAIARLRSRS